MSKLIKVTAKSPVNIALVKYWGKRDSKLILPCNSSISVCLDNTETITTIEFTENIDKHQIRINNGELKNDEKDLEKFIDKILELTQNKNLHARITSTTTVPVAAGLASSAAGFSALALAARSALGLALNEKDLSILARQGSGSACRSIPDGFVEWYKGNNPDGSDSYAGSIVNAEYWPEFRIISTIISTSKKPISSRTGMSQTVETCPFYKGWLETVEDDLESMRKGIKGKDIILVGETAEANALKMHATMITTKPSIIYWLPATIEIINKVKSIRESGIPVYFTIDAGPNVKVICEEKNVKLIERELKKIPDVMETITSKPSIGARLTNEHLR